MRVEGLGRQGPEFRGSRVEQSWGERGHPYKGQGHWLRRVLGFGFGV